MKNMFTTSRTIGQPVFTTCAVAKPLYFAKAIKIVNTSKINLPIMSAINPNMVTIPLHKKPNQVPEQASVVSKVDASPGPAGVVSVVPAAVLAATQTDAPVVAAEGAVEARHTHAPAVEQSPELQPASAVQVSPRLAANVVIGSAANPKLKNNPTKKIIKKWPRRDMKRLYHRDLAMRIISCYLRRYSRSQCLLIF